jgi:hypothetical protein
MIPWNLGRRQGLVSQRTESVRTSTNMATACQTAPLAHPSTALPTSLHQRRDAVALLHNTQSSLASVLSLLLRLCNVLMLCLEHSRRAEQMTWTEDLDHISTA